VINLAVICPYCKNRAKLFTSKEFYGTDYGTNMWVCEPCDARVGTNGNSTTPLGTLAKEELRQLRMECHKRFDILWKASKGKRRMTRTEAYQWLASKMSMSSKEAHIGLFDDMDCIRFLMILKEHGL
jgi:hypothetical protein